MTAGRHRGAVDIAKKMVREFGMSRLGPIYLIDSSKDPQSQNLLDRVEDATTEIISSQLERARDVVTSQQGSISRLVELLLKRDTVEADDIRWCFQTDLCPLAN